MVALTTPATGTSARLCLFDCKSRIFDKDDFIASLLELLGNGVNVVKVDNINPDDQNYDSMRILDPRTRIIYLVEMAHDADNFRYSIQEDRFSKTNSDKWDPNIFFKNAIWLEKTKITQFSDINIQCLQSGSAVYYTRDYDKICYPRYIKIDDRPCVIGLDKYGNFVYTDLTPNLLRKFVNGMIKNPRKKLMSLIKS